MKKTLAFIIISLICSSLFAQIDFTQNPIRLSSYVDNSGRDVCLVWDAQTGKSVFYAWNADIVNWKAYSINLPENPVPGSKVQIMMAPYVDNTGRDVCLVWDTQTGKSVFYAWNTGITNWKAYSINLPENPVAGALGKIMMAPYVDKTGRDVCLVWDTHTGKSVFYAWNSEIVNWKAYSINLPENPVAGAKGNIMMAPYVDKTGRDVCLVWDTQTGKSVFFAWNADIVNWKAYSINLPEIPLTDAKGQIMMVSYVDKTGRDVCLVWDTQTGKSVFYAWNADIVNWKAYSINLPENPVASSKGQIMMVSYVDKAGRDVCLVWDAQTGKSVFYAWNSEITNWKAYSINLPENPMQK